MDNNHARVSIVVPVYNAERYLNRCIGSILAQTFADFELLLIDDGSTDRSGQVCDEYAQKDSRIRVFHTPNKGVSAARNLGIGEASANWITFIDSDDWVECGFIDSLMERLPTKGIVIQRMVCDTNNPSGSTKASSLYFSQYKDAIIKKEQIPDSIVKFKLLNDGYIMAKLYDKRLITNNNIKFCEDLDLFEDLIFLRTYLCSANEIIICHNHNYHYTRQSSISLSHKKHYAEEYLRAAEILIDIFGKLASIYPMHDEQYLKEMFTMHGLSQIVSACSNANANNYKEVFNEARARKSLFKKYYVPRHLYHKLFSKMLLCKWMPDTFLYNSMRLLLNLSRR